MKKRMMTALLAMLMILSLVACGKTENAQNTEAEQTTVTETTAAAESVIDENDGNLDEDDIDLEAYNATMETKSPEKIEAEARRPEEVPVPPSQQKEETSTNNTDPTTETTGFQEYPITDFEWFESLTEGEQAVFVESFDSALDFIEWYNAAEEEYNTLHPSIEIDGTPIDAEEILEVIE